MEIERKFLTKELPFPAAAYPCLEISQAYLSFSPTIRIRKSNEDYMLTVKGKGQLAREEFELPLNREEYEALAKKTEGKTIVKKRYLIPLEEGLTAEVDFYEGELAGLITTEVEFSSLEEAAAFRPPLWFGEDVSQKGEYKNTALSRYGLPQEREKE